MTTFDSSDSDSNIQCLGSKVSLLFFNCKMKEAWDLWTIILFALTPPESHHSLYVGKMESKNNALSVVPRVDCVAKF